MVISEIYFLRRTSTNKFKWLALWSEMRIAHWLPLKCHKWFHNSMKQFYSTIHTNVAHCYFRSLNGSFTATIKHRIEKQWTQIYWRWRKESKLWTPDTGTMETSTVCVIFWLQQRIIPRMERKARSSDPL